MKFISTKQLHLDIRANSWKVRQCNPKGIIGIPRSGIFAGILLSQELHIGICSPTEFIEANGQDYVFYRHGKRTVDCPDDGTIIVMEDSCYHGSMKRIVDILRRMFPDQKFLSCCAYLEGPCDIYRPDIWLMDIRRESLIDRELPTALYEWNLLDGYFNFKYLWDCDGVLCVNPPSDSNLEEYEKYLESPVPLHIPKVECGNKIDICTYRIDKYRKQTEAFMIANNIPVRTLYMFNADTINQRNKTSSGAYKAFIYKNNPYKLFIESNDNEAQEIYEISRKPVYCTETGRMYQMKQ